MVFGLKIVVGSSWLWPPHLGTPPEEGSPPETAEARGRGQSLRNQRRNGPPLATQLGFTKCHIETNLQIHNCPKKKGYHQQSWVFNPQSNTLPPNPRRMPWDAQREGKQPLRSSLFAWHHHYQLLNVFHRFHHTKSPNAGGIWLWGFGT